MDARRESGQPGKKDGSDGRGWKKAVLCNYVVSKFKARKFKARVPASVGVTLLQHGGGASPKMHSLPVSG